MVSHDNNAIGIAEVVLACQFQFFQLHRRHMRVRVSDQPAPARQQQHDVNGRRFAHIVNIALVRNAVDMDLRTLDRFRMIVQSILDLGDHKVRHLPVDVASQFDKARLNPGLLRFPGEIERIDRDTVPAQTRSGIERHKAKRLSSRRFNHFPDIDIHAVAHDGDLIRQTDVDHAKRVFKQLHHLRNLRRTHRYHVFQSLLIEDAANLCAGGCRSAHHFGYVLRLKLGVPRVYALRREA